MNEFHNWTKSGFYY